MGQVGSSASGVHSDGRVTGSPAAAVPTGNFSDILVFEASEHLLRSVFVLSRKHIMTCSEDNRFLVWDVGVEKAICELEPRSGAHEGVDWDEECQSAVFLDRLGFIVGAFDSKLVVWDFPSGAIAFVIPTDSGKESLLVRINSTHLVSAGRELLTLYNLRALRETKVSVQDVKEYVAIRSEADENSLGINRALGYQSSVFLFSLGSSPNYSEYDVEESDDGIKTVKRVKVYRFGAPIVDAIVVERLKCVASLHSDGSLALTRISGRRRTLDTITLFHTDNLSSLAGVVYLEALESLVVSLETTMHIVHIGKDMRLGCWAKSRTDEVIFKTISIHGGHGWATYTLDGVIHVWEVQREEDRGATGRKDRSGGECRLESEKGTNVRRDDGSDNPSSLNRDKVQHVRGVKLDGASEGSVGSMSNRGNAEKIAFILRDEGPPRRIVHRYIIPPFHYGMVYSMVGIDQYSFVTSGKDGRLVFYKDEAGEAEMVRNKFSRLFF